MGLSDTLGRKVTAEAKLLGDASRFKGTLECYSPGRRKDLLDRCCEEIAEGENALSVKTAGDDTAVNENGNLVPESVAGMPCRHPVRHQDRATRNSRPIRDTNDPSADSRPAFL